MPRFIQPRVHDSDDDFPYDEYLRAYTYPDLLKDYESQPPLPQERLPNLSLKPVPTGVLSKTYTEFADPIIKDGSHPSFEVHIYFNIDDPEEKEYAYKLHERIRREFPELKIYCILETPWASHTAGMWEVNVHTPAQFGAFIPWLVINRGPLGCFMHPNTGDEIRDHVQRFTLFGNPPRNNMAKFTLFKDMTPALEAERKEILLGNLKKETDYVTITGHEERMARLRQGLPPDAEEH
ncbi:unnamed protein product [Penicillium pancosmium]